MSDINTSLKWMSDRQGSVTYSMIYRYGPLSYDCSSAVYYALIAGGFLPPNSNIGNTETLFNDLERNGWQQVQPDTNGNYPAKRGDVFIWGKRGFTLGAAGHTGIFVDDNDNIIHCNYGYNGITVNPHDFIWSINGQPPITIYRYVGGAPVQPQSKIVKRTYSQYNQDKPVQLGYVAPTVGLSYRLHLTKHGWGLYVADSQLAGSTGQSNTAEAIEVRINNSLDWVNIDAHIAQKGWTGYKKGTNGTTGKALQMEAIKLTLNGELAKQYKIVYRVHQSSIGWSEWVSDGRQAGIIGQRKGIEAVEIKLVRK
ncbi:peptidoglycan amidohydrolase family protein [Enterococcus sp. AZ126]|uniref:peptidoglycan amidohydrolase family protein n=1 Tax=Enterococcus sp. AZ126 TaxID=2774635 RepID=UPI003F270D03